MKQDSGTAAASLDLTSLGLRPITRWVPDTHDPAFKERYRQQRAVIAAAVSGDSEVEWWESAQSHEGWS